MFPSLIDLSGQRRYWLGLIVLGIALEAAALYFQYVLDEWPCLLCIHVRIWIAAFVLLALFALMFNDFRSLTRVLHVAVTLVMAALVERSWQVLAIERGWVFGDCEMDLGMPAWFALDKWFPWIFEVQTSCGYTPFIVFEITLAEVLLAISVALAAFSAAVTIASFLDD